eukprot:CAMPEP_0174263236 /NCGR_PEP_ID=MMETSP0439-20130205/17807_1 /TAXON_ID=0 /ORGANISM="Stereomyxa ramosa, Strain Chinc5" /LENGTH=497 /DNA_ID=CAMNT_0015348483 /DNA_START=71 /DNA_END=1564 /DNA_ORIENTATION=-
MEERQSYPEDYPEFRPLNDDCRGRQLIHLNENFTVSPSMFEEADDFEEVTRIPCSQHSPSPALWYSIRGSGKTFFLTACLPPESLLWGQLWVGVITDRRCYPDYDYSGNCNEEYTQCRHTDCVESTPPTSMFDPFLCLHGLRWETELGREYYIAMYIMEGPDKRHLSQREIALYEELVEKNVDCEDCKDIGFQVKVSEVCELEEYKNQSECIMGCDGVWGSGKVLDVCGVCGGDNSKCLTGCDLQPHSNLQEDPCGVCGGNGSTCMGCDGVPVKDVRKRKVFDQCGVCGGDGSSCADCYGVLDGIGQRDICGVCFGDGTSCLDCAGCPNGTAVVDQCGVCGGSNDCLGCDGEINSGLIPDECGECGGHGLSCRGCNDIPYAVYDECGVCNGDGSSCTCVFYEDFRHAEMDCRLIEFTFNETLEIIDDHLQLLEETLLQLQNCPGHYNDLIKYEVKLARAFLEETELYCEFISEWMEESFEESDFSFTFEDETMRMLE